MVSINPRGPSMLYYPFGYYLEERNPSFDIVTEFQSPNFHEPMALLFAAGVLVFVTLGVRRRSFNIVEGLLAAAFTLQAFGVGPADVDGRTSPRAAAGVGIVRALRVGTRAAPPPDREATIARVEAAA